MSSPEIQFDLLRNVQTSLSILEKGSYEHLADLAYQMKHDIDQDEFQIRFGHYETMTGVTVDIEYDEQNEIIELYQTLHVDAGKAIGARPQILQADLVRTLYVMEQLPHNGDHRMKEVYGSALDQQKEWLNDNMRTHVRQDPRVITDRQHLLKNILGEKRFFTDFGRSDYEKAVRWSFNSVDMVSRIVLTNFLDPRQFMVAREQVQNLWWSMRKTSGVDITSGKLGDDDIAKWLSQAMVAHVLHESKK